MEDDNRTLENFLILQKIGKMPYDYIDTRKKSTLYLEDYHYRDPDPTCKQMKNGFFLEMSKEIPYSIWSPWGEWRCWGRGRGEWRNASSDLLIRLGAKKYKKDRMELRRKYPKVGVLYAVTSIEGTSVPEAVPLSVEEFGDHLEILNSWDFLVETYEKEFNNF